MRWPGSRPGRRRHVQYPESREEEGTPLLARDFVSWGPPAACTARSSGSVFTSSPQHDLRNWPSWVWLLIGNVNVDHATAVFLIALIYGVPWIITAQLTAEMIFVGLTSWQPYLGRDREWFGRSTGWFASWPSAGSSSTFLVLIAGEFVLWLVGKYNSAKYSSAMPCGRIGPVQHAAGQERQDRLRERTPNRRPATKCVLPLAAILFLVSARHRDLRR